MAEVLVPAPCYSLTAIIVAQVSSRSVMIDDTRSPHDDSGILECEVG